jgi:hypothetical protein
VNGCSSRRRRPKRPAYIRATVVKTRCIRRSPNAAVVTYYGLGSGRNGRIAEESKAKQDGACSSYTINAVS